MIIINLSVWQRSKGQAMVKSLVPGLGKGVSRFAVALVLGATAVAAQAEPVTTQGTWWGTDGTDGTLKGRDINGNAVALNSADAVFFYDTKLNITWLRDWNADGQMNWASAKAWAASLNIGGFTGWRLPEVSAPEGESLNITPAYTGTDRGYNVNITNSELAHMFYVTLGNLAFYDSIGNEAQSGWGLTNTAYFTNMQSFDYWSGTEDALDPSYAWFFNTGYGLQGNLAFKNLSLYAVAVRPGDVLAAQAVPEPGTLGLLLAALGVGAVVRRRRAR